MKDSYDERITAFRKSSQVVFAFLSVIMSNNKVQCIVVRLEMKTLRGIWE
jgi:hypothetical protein